MDLKLVTNKQLSGGCGQNNCKVDCFLLESTDTSSQVKEAIKEPDQLQRTSQREYVIEPTKTNAGTRVIPMTNEVIEMFRTIIEDRPDYRVEKVVDGYTGFLFLDKDGMTFVAMHLEHRFNHMVSRYNEIYKVQMPNITPHSCLQTYILFQYGKVRHES